MPVSAFNTDSNCRKEYKKRINKVLTHIDEHFNAKLSVEILAEVACFSPYHFHRIFHSVLGENVNDYVKKIRISKAAYRLLYCPELTVTEIAFECGFSSLSDFSRSFKAFYNTSPVKYQGNREKTLLPCTNSCPSLKAFHAKANSEPYSVQYKAPDQFIESLKITELADLHVAFIRCTGLSKKLENSSIEQAFAKLFKWALPRKLITVDTRVLGVTLDSPEVLPMRQCRYDACITVSGDTSPDSEIGVRLLKSVGEYVAFTFTRNKPDANLTFFTMTEYIYGYWLPENGYLPDDKPFIEFYRQEADTGDILTDFYIPIKPL